MLLCLYYCIRFTLCFHHALIQNDTHLILDKMCIKLICNLYNDISTSLLSMFGDSVVLVSFAVESLHQTWKISSSTLKYALDNSVLVYNNRKIFVVP